MANEILVPAITEEMRDVLERTNMAKPAQEDVDRLRQFLVKNPGIWRYTGDLARQAQANLVESMSTVAAIKESVLHGVSVMREELGYSTATPIEKPLIEHAVLGYLDYHVTQRHYDSAFKQGVSSRGGALWERRLNSAHRRYMRALEILAKVRKMGPALQINIAEKQINQISR